MTIAPFAPAKRGQISPMLIMKALSEANDYQLAHPETQVIHLSLGQPGDRVPEAVIKRAQTLLDNHKLGYTEACGLRPLRERIASHYQQRYGVTVPVERIMLTVGSSAAFFLALIGAFEPGQRVGMIEPCYPPYRNLLQAFGLEMVRLEGTLENRFQPTVEMLRQAGPMDGLIIASPSNPAGTVIHTPELQQLMAYATEQGIRVISDEIYHGITYDGLKVDTALSTNLDAIVINSFSKYFLMPGWRLGWVVAPEWLCPSMEAMLQNFFVSPPALAQFAALAAFDCQDELNAVVTEKYAVNRRIFLEGLSRAGFTGLCPAEGAFYVYADISGLTHDSAAFCQEMLQEAQVVAVAGHDFDSQRGDQFIRFSYCCTTEEAIEAMRRIQNWLDTKRQR